MIQWAEPTELNDEYDLAVLTLFAKENIVQLCTFPRWILKSPELAFSPIVPEHHSYFLQHLTLDSSLPFLGCKESTQNHLNCRKTVGFTPETIGGGRLPLNTQVFLQTHRALRESGVWHSETPPEFKNPFTNFPILELPISQFSKFRG